MGRRRELFLQAYLEIRPLVYLGERQSDLHQRLQFLEMKYLLEHFEVLYLEDQVFVQLQQASRCLEHQGFEEAEHFARIHAYVRSR
jgi:hypothetical protein